MYHMGYRDRRGYQGIRWGIMIEKGSKVSDGALMYQRGIAVSYGVSRYRSGIKIQEGIKVSDGVSRYQMGYQDRTWYQCIRWGITVSEGWYQDRIGYQGMRVVSWHQVGIKIEECIKVSCGYQGIIGVSR